MARTNQPPVDRPVMSRADRAGLWLVAGFAVTVAILAAVGTVLSAFHALGEDPLEVHDLPLGNARTPEFTEPLGQVVTARYETVTMTVAGLPPSARWLLLGSVIVGSLAVIGVCLTLVWLCLRVLQLRPFGRSVTVALVTSAVLIIVGGSASQILAAAGNAAVVSFLGPAATGATPSELPGASEGLSVFSLDLNLAPIGVGVALAVIAVAFQIGARMQRDTEGLV